MLANTLIAASLPLLALAAPQYGAAYPDTTSSSSVAAPSTTAAATASSAAAPATTTAAGGSVVHKVIVGGGPLTYQPNFVDAAIGDTIVFEFHSKNHTLTQSSFATPCSPLVNGTTPIGIDAGFVPVGVNATVFPTFNVTVEETTPLWFYCRQGEHCSAGMVFGLNAPKTGNTIEAFVAKAMNSTVAPYTATASAILTGAGVAGKSHPSSLVNPTDPIDPPASSYVSQLPASAANGTSAAGTASGSASSPTATTKSSANKVTLGAGLSLVGAVVALFV